MSWHVHIETRGYCVTGQWLKRSIYPISLMTYSTPAWISRSFKWVRIVCVFCVCDCTHAYWVERTAKYLGKLFNLMRLKTFCKVRAHKKNPKGVTLGNPIWSRNHWRQRVSHAALPTPVPTDQQRREPLSNSNFNFEENYPKNAPRSGTFSPPQQSVRSNERKSGSP